MRNNHIELQGTLTKDIELFKSQKGNSFIRFTVACLRDGNDNRIDYLNCVAFKESAEKLYQIGKKDIFLKIIGNLQTSSYEKDGKKNYSTNVVVESFEVLKSE